MPFQIERGLFKLDFTDHHAVLGVPVDADNREIRKRYLRIAKNLHPDSSSSESKADKQLANDLLSKLVNPAYEKLSNEKERTDYAIMLRLMGQKASMHPVEIHGELAQQLKTSPDIDQAYKTALQQLAGKQYQSFHQMLELTGEISELNLVYLMRKQGEPEKNPAKKSAVSKTKPPTKPPAPATTTTPPAPPKKSPVEDYYRRAEELIEKGNLAKAILELRDAIKLEPMNSSCHSLLGNIYLRQKQATMAKVHINKALELNPKDEKALEGQKNLEKLVRANKKAAAAAKSDNKGDGITIFGIKIGGGKKK